MSNELSGKKVYAVGNVDYDIRVALPGAIYSTLDAAQAHIPNATWEEDGTGGWYTRHRGSDYAIQEYEIDA